MNAKRYSLGLVKTLEILNQYKDEIKRQAMIFQYDEKVKAAILIGIPQNSLLKFSYANWNIISQQIVLFQNEAEANFKGKGSTLCGDIWTEYAKANPQKMRKLRSLFRSLMIEEGKRT